MLGLIGGLLGHEAYEAFAKQEAAEEVDTIVAVRVRGSEQHLLERLQELRQAEVLVEEPKPTPSPIPTPTAVPLPPTPTPAPPDPTAIYPYHELICSFDWDCATALAVVCDESGFNTYAENPSGARGLFQIIPDHAWRFAARGWDYWVDVFVPARNVAIAYELWTEQGWSPWLASAPWTC